MGLFSWITNLYTDHQFQKANQLFLESDYYKAIEILHKILDKHPDAPSKLLSVYHALISAGHLSKIEDVANLFRRFNSLKNLCVSYSNALTKISGGSEKTQISYYQALYNAGLSEFESPFITLASNYVEKDLSCTRLDSLTSNQTLLYALSQALYVKVEELYQSNLNSSACERLCELILPYCSSKSFYSIYSNVQINRIISQNFSTHILKSLDQIIDNIHDIYKLSIDEIKRINDKLSTWAKQIFNAQKYDQSLQICQRILSEDDNAKRIYADSALQLYLSSNPAVNLINDTTLYQALGKSNEQLISALEPYIPYAQHKQKYVKLVINQLSCELSPSKDIRNKLQLFTTAWKQTADLQLIFTVLTQGLESTKKIYAQYIVENADLFLSNKSQLKHYLSLISKLHDHQFVVSLMESLISLGKSIAGEYELEILVWADSVANNYLNQIEIIDWGLAHVQTKGLFAQKAIYCYNYIKQRSYNIKFAKSVADSLIGKDDLAEVLHAKILLDEAKSASNTEIQEEKLRKALYYKESHATLFNQQKYTELLPEINELILALAKKVYEQEPQRAIALFYLLRDYSLHWYDDYASLILSSFASVPPSKLASDQILSIIQEGKNIVSEIKDQLWQRYVEIETVIRLSSDINQSIDLHRDLKANLSSKCTTSNKLTLLRTINRKLSELLSQRGKDYERAKNWESAQCDYEEILGLISSIEIKYRLYICKLKQGELLLDYEEQAIQTLIENDTLKSAQKDLAYRWCIYLLRNDQFEEAKRISNSILSSDSKIEKLCRDKEILRQQHILDELNENIDRLNKSDLSPQDAIALGQSLEKILNEISTIVQVSNQKKTSIKRAIRSYAIQKYYEMGDYVQSEKGFKVHDSNYLSDPLALRNIAIMCLRAAESDQLTNENYKEFISIWATAIYQQDLFIQSLDYTTWDDPYTFTLNQALGQLTINEDDLPNNVNFEQEGNDKVVAIHEVQKALISRMEAALADHTTYQQFFSAEIEAMDKLADQNLDVACVLVAPYLLTMSNTYRDSVTNALTIEERGHYSNWETIIEIGNAYGLTNGMFGTYIQAKALLQKAISTINNAVPQVKVVFTPSNIAEIKKFERLWAQLMSAVSTAMNSVIATNPEGEELYNQFGHVIRTLADDTLSFSFSNYINQCVVKALNEKSIPLSKGALLLFKIHSFCECNPHLKRNIENIIEALIHNYLTDGDEDNLNVLERVLSNTRKYDAVVIKALNGGDDLSEKIILMLYIANKNRFNVLQNHLGSNSIAINKQFNQIKDKISTLEVQLELSQIVDKVNNNSMDKADALQKVYAMYCKNRDNNRICENLAILIPMCIMEYIITRKSGKAKVESVLDALKTNLSSTFRAHNANISQAYNGIWSQLDSNARWALQFETSSLNEQGLALKRGLDYLQALK